MTITSVSLTEIGLDDEERSAALEVLKSGKLREGERVREFEKIFQAYVGTRHAMATSSGTAALHLSYLSLFNPGDEVLVPAFTFVATASMIAMAGGVPVFCDIDPETWVIDPRDIERKITPKTKAIAGVHLFGNTCDIAAIREIAVRHHLKIIWDAAQALGSRYQDIDIAQFPDAVCFSFYPSKNITTGEGGMVTTNDDGIATKVRLLKSHGQPKKYVHEILGFNYRMTEVEAAIGVVQLQKLEGFLERRKRVAARLREAFEGNGFFKMQQITSGCDHATNYFSILLKENCLSVSRDQLVQALKDEGVPCAVHYPIPLHRQPCFSQVAFRELPHSDAVAQNILSLPMHPFLSDQDADFVAEKVLNLVRQYSK